MTYGNWLVRRAQQYWMAGKALPVSLFNEMNRAGLNIDLAHRQFNQQLEQA